MGSPLITEEREDSPLLRDVGYVPRVSRLESWGAAGHEAFLDNPEQAAARMVELYDANQDQDKISEDEFNRKYSNLGIEWDEDYSQRGAEIVAGRKREELRRRQIMSANSDGIVNTAGMFGTSLLASLLSPVNIGMSFIPVGGQARWAAITAKHGRTIAALSKGAVEGFVGSALTEPLAFAARRHEQADYTSMDSLYNLTLGSVVGSGLHYGGMKLGDMVRTTAQKSAQGQLMATHIATEQILNGKQVDVSALKVNTDMDIILHSRQASESLRSKRTEVSTLDFEEVRAGRAEVQVTKAGQEVSVKFKGEEGRLTGLTGTGKDKDTAVSNLISEYERLRNSIETDPRASKIEQLQLKLESLVAEREIVEQMLSTKRRLPKELQDAANSSIPLAATLRAFDDQIALAEAQATALAGIDATGKAHEISVIKNKADQLRKSKASMQDLMKKLKADNVSRINRDKLKEVKSNIKDVVNQIQSQTVAMAQDTLRRQATQQSDLFHQEKPEKFNEKPEAFSETTKEEVVDQAVEEAEGELRAVLNAPKEKVEKPSPKEGTPIEDGKAQEAEVDLANLSDVERADFYVEKVGDAQRNGDPETLMVAAQDEMGGGMQSFAIEHIGDLTHRMADKNTLSSMGFADVKDKVTKVLDKIDQEFWFAKENRQNLENNALWRFAEQEGIEDVWAIRDTLVATPKFKEFFNTYMDGVTQKLEAYADAHSKIPVFNKPQKLARDAAVFMGRSDFLEAGHALRQLSKILDEGQEAWVKAAREFDPEIAGFGRDAEVTGPRKALFDLEAEVLEAKTRLGEDSEEFDDFLIEADSRRHDLLGREKGRTPKHFFSKAPRFKLAQETEGKLIPDDVKFDEGGAPGAKEVDAPTPEAEAREAKAKDEVKVESEVRALLKELDEKLHPEERRLLEEGAQLSDELAVREESLNAGMSCIIKNLGDPS